jgi:hypothetical protein
LVPPLRPVELLLLLLLLQLLLMLLLLPPLLLLLLLLLPLLSGRANGPAATQSRLSASVVVVGPNRSPRHVLLSRAAVVAHLAAIARGLRPCCWPASRPRLSSRR